MRRVIRLTMYHEVSCKDTIKNTKDLFYYGHLTWLWTNSPLHREWSTKAQARLIIPAIALKQFHLILNSDNLPVAYCSWAWLSQEKENEFIRRVGYIDPNSWNCGDRLWIIDYISPFSLNYTRQLNEALARKFPDKIARALRVKPGNPKGKIISFRGPKLSIARKKNMNHDFTKQVEALISSNIDK